MLTSLNGKHIVLGVTGGIAAYKTPELVRELARAGAEVEVVATRSAYRFVTPVTLQAVSGRPVRGTLWDAAAEAAMGHIELARWADAIVVAPATAHTIARFAQGQADDLLTTIYLATRAPVAVAPAMNQQMWAHPATRRNLDRITADGVAVFGPATGAQACGEFGPGRMLEPLQLTACIAGLFGPQRLAGRRVLITAGPTREPLDPVRFISNHSSGKQGLAIATAARDAGAAVTVVHGPLTEPMPSGVDTVAVETAQQMHDAVQAAAGEADIFIAVAAVADYRPSHPESGKIKKEDRGEAMALELTRNPDILAAVAARPDPPFTVGFAAETDDVMAQARAKRLRKGIDMIVVNDVSGPEIGFNAEHNAVTLIHAGGEVVLSRAPKTEISRQLIDHLADRFEAWLANTNPESIAK